MPDLDKLLAPQRWDATRCTVPQALAELDDEWRPKVEAAIGNDKVLVRGVMEVFRELIGESPASLTIRRHRARVCRCAP